MAAGGGDARAHLQGVIGKVGTGVKLKNQLSAMAAPQAKGDPNNIKVGVRVRPLNKTEKGMGEDVICEFSGNSICMNNPAPEDDRKGQPEETIFTFDHLYHWETATEQVFQDMGNPLVDKLFDGFNATLFAYGQTGSGKTHSMMGNAQDPGVIPKVCGAIFEKVRAASEDTTISVRASYIQIYREALEDLCVADKGDLKIRRDPKFGTYVQGLSEHELTSPAGLTNLIEEGNKRRAVASTLMNAESSRSHAVVVIKVDQEIKGEGAKVRKQSKINLVDLAGSERSSKTGAQGDTLKEAISINQSLSALGNVINALTDPKYKGHIPYRSSKLTHLLEESLGGNSNTVMLAAMSPAGRNYHETLMTLQYAQRAKLIVTKVTANMSIEEERKSKFGGGGGAAAEAAMAMQMQQMQAVQQAAMAQQQQQLMAKMAAESSLASKATQQELDRAREERAAAAASLAAAQAQQRASDEAAAEAKSRLADAERQAAERAAEAAAELAREKAEGSEAVAAARREAAAAVDAARAEVSEARDKLAEAQAAAAAAAVAAAEEGAAREVAAARAELLLEEARRGRAEDAAARQKAEEELVQLRLQLATAEARAAAATEQAAALGEAEAAMRATLAEQRAAHDVLHARLEEELSRRLEQQTSASAETHAADASRADAMARAIARLEETQAAQAQRSADEIAKLQGAVTEQLRALGEQQSAVVAEKAERRRTAAEGGASREEIARLEAGHAAELERLQARARDEASQAEAALAAAERRREEEVARAEAVRAEAAARHDEAAARSQAALLEAQAEQVRVQTESATRRAAADALGERVVLLQEQIASVQLDHEQARHAQLAEKAQMEQDLRDRQEDLEAARVEGLQAQHEAARLKAQLADQVAALQKLHAVYERTVQETRRAEDEAAAERHALHAERRALEQRLHEESKRAQKSNAELEKLKREGLLGRLMGGAPSTDGR